MGKKWATFALEAKTDVSLKHETEGGFSCKRKIECSAEIGPEARTYRPSPSPSPQTAVINKPDMCEGEESRNMVSVPEGALG